MLVSGGKSASDSLLRFHHVSDGRLRKILGTTRIVTGTSDWRNFHRDVG